MRRLLLLVCVCVGLARPVTAQVVFGNASSSLLGASPATFSHTVPAGSNGFLFVSVVNGSSTDVVTGVTYNTVAMTRSFSVIVSDAGALQPVLLTGWTLVAPSTGANTVSVTYTGAGTLASAGALSFTGVHQTTPVALFSGLRAVHLVGIPGGFQPLDAMIDSAASRCGVAILVGAINEGTGGTTASLQTTPFSPLVNQWALAATDALNSVNQWGYTATDAGFDAAGKSQTVSSMNQDLTATVSDSPPFHNLASLVAEGILVLPTATVINGQ